MTSGSLDGPRARELRTGAGLLLLLPVAIALDRWTYQALYLPLASGADSVRMFRIAGYFFVWVLIAAAVWRLDRRPCCRWLRGQVAAVGLLAGIGAAAGLGSGLKLLVRRLRPPVDGFELFVWRPWAERSFDAGGLSFPSGHATVAFTGALILGRLYSPLRPVVLLWATGCALTRILPRHHYFSDTWGSLILAWSVAFLIWRLYLWVSGQGPADVPQRPSGPEAGSQPSQITNR